MERKITAAELARIAQNSSKKSRISGGIAKMSQTSSRIPKYKFEANTGQVLIVPLSLCLPFNPFELDAPGYSERNPFVLKTSVETAWAVCCQLMLQNPAVKARFEQYLGKITEKEMNAEGYELALLLTPFRNIEPYVEYTCHTTLEAFGQYGRSGCVKHTKDVDGNPQFEGLLADLSSLEYAFIAPELKEFNESIKPGGKNANLTQKQRTTMRQNIRAKAVIDLPRSTAVIRFLGFKIEGDNLGNGVIEQWKQRGPIAFDSYMKVSATKLQAFTKKLGSKHDIYPSYIEYKVETGDSDPMSMWDEAPTKEVVGADDSYTAQFTNATPDKPFLAKYIEYRDDADLWDDQVMLNSVPDFKPIPDAILIEAYQTSILTYDRSLFRAEILERHGDTIRRVSEDLYDSLENDAIKGKLSDLTVSDDDVAAFLKADASDASDGFETSEVASVEAAIASDAVLNGMSGTTPNAVSGAVPNVMQGTVPNVMQGAASNGMSGVVPNGMPDFSNLGTPSQMPVFTP